MQIMWALVFDRIHNEFKRPNNVEVYTQYQKEGRRRRRAVTSFEWWESERVILKKNTCAISNWARRFHFSHKHKSLLDFDPFPATFEHSFPSFFYRTKVHSNIESLIGKNLAKNGVQVFDAIRLIWTITTTTKKIRTNGNQIETHTKYRTLFHFVWISFSSFAVCFSFFFVVTWGKQQQSSGHSYIKSRYQWQIVAVSACATVWRLGVQLLHSHVTNTKSIQRLAT